MRAGRRFWMGGGECAVCCERGIRREKPNSKENVMLCDHSYSKWLFPTIVIMFLLNMKHKKHTPLPAELTRLPEDGASLVVGGSQAGSTHVVEASLVDARVKDTKQRLLLLPLGHDLVINKGGEHLRLDEVGEEGEVRLRLIGEERGLEQGQTQARR